MKYYGGLTENLKRAVINARRARGRPKSPDTLAFWNSLLLAGRQKLRTGKRKSSKLPALLLDLEEELALEKCHERTV